MPEHLLLAHDIGTSATKTSVVSSAGHILDTQSHGQKSLSPKTGWSEQAPREWWEGVCANTRRLMKRHPDYRSRIAAIGVSGHMLGAVLLDADGNVLRPALTHADTRSSRQCAFVEKAIGGDRVYQTTGNILDSRSPLCKLLWVRDNEPAVAGRIARCIQSKDYIVGKMVGAFETSDYSDASHAQFLDVHRMAYATDMIKALGIDPSILPELRASTNIAGTLSDEAATALGLPSGIPVSTGGGDGACASAGAGSVGIGDTYCCFGTTAWISMNADKAFIDPEKRVFNIVSLDGKACGVFGTVQCAGRSIDWMRDVFSETDYDKMDRDVQGITPGSDGLLFLPYLEGERAPIYDSNARGVFFGLTPSHDRRHFLRATVEGVCLGLRSVVEILRETKPVEHFRIIGGGARSGALRSILASACNAEIRMLSVAAADATSLGAAIAAGVAVGLFKDLAEGSSAIREMASDSPDPEAVKTYANCAELQIEIYERLKTLFARNSEC